MRFCTPVISILRINSQAIRAASVQLLDASGNRFRYAVQADEQLAPVLSAALVRAGFALYGLWREQRTLETVFAEVNALAPDLEQRDAA